MRLLIELRIFLSIGAQFFVLKFVGTFNINTSPSKVIKHKKTALEGL